ncbi:Uridine-cytidine kinase C [Triticum urartu]|uniref:Uridine-cytidine kinase C n=1 Tax=Triticum urartu TaxID=4572 RepID=M8A0Y7_TRIUA|nr:Uridine-cytidine kinase C [Triticum urartu]
MENYRTGAGADEGSDIDSIDFDALACNLQLVCFNDGSECSQNGGRGFPARSYSEGACTGCCCWKENTSTSTIYAFMGGCIRINMLIIYLMRASMITCINYYFNVVPPRCMTSILTIMFAEQELVKGKDTLMPLVDFQEKKRTGWRQLKISSSGVVIVDGAYALHSTLRSLLDIRVAVVGGVHFSLLSKVQHDIGDSCSLDYLIDSIFPLFRKHIEPDLHHAQIRIDNSFVCSFREPYYKLKCKNEMYEILPDGQKFYSFDKSKSETENFIEMYLRPPFASEEIKIDDWIKVTQCGIRYYLSLGDQRIVDKFFIIRPKAEFEVGRTTLGGLLALGYSVVVSFKRTSRTVKRDQLLIAAETIDSLNESFLVLKGPSRKIVAAEASNLGIKGPWITKSYLEMILESKGVPRVNTPPPVSSTLLTDSQEKKIAVPKPIRVLTDRVANLDDFVQPWTRSPPKKFDQEPSLGKWQFIPDSSSRGNIQLAPLPDSYDLDRGLLLSVQAIQAVLETKGFPVIVGIGGPSGSGKTSLAQKMANIIGCEVISLESYYKPEQVRDYKYDEYSSLDIALLTKQIPTEIAAKIRDSENRKADPFLGLLVQFTGQPNNIRSAVLATKVAKNITSKTMPPWSDRLHPC